VAWGNGTGEWVNITSGERDIESWEWDTSTVTDGDNYKIRITATDLSEYSLQEVALSDLFSIDNPDPPIVKVIFPDGGEIVNDTVQISWIATDVDGDLLTADVDYSSDGKKWINIVEDLDFTDGGIPGSWYYNWDTRELPDGENYRIRVKVKDHSPWALETEDFSEGRFRIYNPDAPEIFIKAFLDGEVLAGEIPIMWRADDADLELLLINIYISPDGGNSWELIAEDERNDGTFMWDTTGVNDGTYVVKLTAYDGLLGAEDVSGEFVIKNLEDPGLGLSLAGGLIIGSVLVLLLGCGLFLMVLRKGKKKTEETLIAESPIPSEPFAEVDAAQIDPAQAKSVRMRVVKKKIRNNTGNSLP
jgi:hypothetical protein